MCVFCCDFCSNYSEYEQQKKKVILEKYTGIKCGYCPDGEAIANSIVNANPGNAFIVNIHNAGSFSVPSAGQPDFRTPFGAVLVSQANPSGFSAGSVNRYVFSGLSMISGYTAMGRDSFVNASVQILGHDAYVNEGAEAEIDVATRTITVNVEMYYTGSSPFATNKLNVALLQDNTVGMILYSEFLVKKMQELTFPDYLPVII
mgnify:CR=1 FL=1